MIKVLSTNIISPLGFSSEENFRKARAGVSGMRRYTGLWGMPEPVTASLFSEEQNAALAEEGLTRFESLAYASAERALRNAAIDVSSGRVVFILASTKGNIEHLSHGDTPVSLARSAKVIAKRLGVATEPIVVCNACISGASAQLLSLRLIDAGLYDSAIVCGADCLSQFVVAGFSSLKTLSPDACRPFDAERYGLNLGEAAATIVYGKARPEDAAECWCLQNGAVRNDACHISHPSKTAEGQFLAIDSALAEAPEVSMVSVHGTATLFSDNMEAIALKRADLQTVPVMAVKGYFGHTMGAAGIMETIIAMLAADAHQTLPAKGFSEPGVPADINIANRPLAVEGHSILKIISGFGGCNAALYLNRKGAAKGNSPAQLPRTKTTHCVRITPEEAVIDGVTCETKEKGQALLTELYKKQMGDYPKYYKMDGLSRLAVVASTLLLTAEDSTVSHAAHRAVLLFNQSSSIAADRAFESTFRGEYFPSPSAFVYTLPNIAAGEIAIKNGYHGETSFYILRHKQPELMDAIVRSSLLDPEMHSSLCGWIDYESETRFEAELYIREKA